MRILLSEIQFNRVILERVEQADKLYFKTGKLPIELRDKIINITGGDSFTKLVSDLVYHFLKFGNGKDYTGELKLGEIFYQYLTEYDKTIFPVKFDLFVYNAEDNTPNEKHVLDLYTILQERHYLINNFRKLPSIAIRNLKHITKTVGNQPYVFKIIDDKIREMVGCVETIPNTEKGKIVLNKIFNSKNDFERTLEIAKHYRNAFTVTSDEDRETLLEVLPILNVNLIQDSNDVMVIKVNDQESMRRIGCTSAWCFALPHSDGYWEDYTPNGYVYVIFDFKIESEDAKFLMVYLPDSGTVYASTNVPLEEIGIEYGLGYLSKIGVITKNLN